MLRYIRDKNNLGLKYHSKIEDEPIYDLLGQASIKSENQVMVLSGSIWQDFPDTGRSTGAYNVFYQGGPIDYCIHVPVPVSHCSAESEYNTVFTALMALSHFRILNNEPMNKDSCVVL